MRSLYWASTLWIRMSMSWFNRYYTIRELTTRMLSYRLCFIQPYPLDVAHIYSMDEDRINGVKSEYGEYFCHSRMMTGRPSDTIGIALSDVPIVLPTSQGRLNSERSSRTLGDPAKGVQSLIYSKTMQYLFWTLPNALKSSQSFRISI